MPRTRQSDPLLTQTAFEKFNLIDLIPMYDGGESLGIRRFLGKINDVANLGKWSNDEKVTILKLKLTGIAEEFFLSDPTHSQLTEYNDIARILIERLEKAVPLSTRLQLFSSCIQGPSESVQEFAARINKLGTQIFQSGNSAQNTAVRNANDQLLQSRFISGLRNDIRRFVLSRDPLNLEESINAALIEEQNMKLNQIASEERSGLSSAQTENPVLSALADRLQEINLKVGRLQEASAVTARKSEKEFLGAPLTPPKRVTRFPRLEKGNVPINTSWFGLFWGISRVLEESSTTRGYPSADSSPIRKADCVSKKNPLQNTEIPKTRLGPKRDWAQNEIAVVLDFHKRILFSDEAHFWLNGYVNKQNCRIWSEANPQVYVETPLHSEKLTVCALYELVESFFKNNEGHNVTVNGDRYRAMITNFFIPVLNNHAVQELWFQQDGATCRTARATID
ncbi:transposable element Tc3 transposase [Trichonephila clavipes]|nr:transposable element Tc3 transposase [Trichonephila clavipes]